ncbi:MAG: histidinol dehydrogenase [Armatimonadota bacterium]
MKIFETEKDSYNDILAAVAPKNAGSAEDIANLVASIIDDVKTRGDEALLELGKKFDSPNLDNIVVTDYEFEAAYRNIDDNLLNAIRTAKENIKIFHEKQMQKSWIDFQEDKAYGQIIRPIEKVGFYAPGGLAPYPSTVLMAAVPAKVAGVKTVAMTSPVQKDGKISAPMLVAAKECGVDYVYKAGGAQAIAALAFGTDSVVKVDKIVGPGNAFVTEAKRQLFGIVGIDQLAGPSEILVIADNTAEPAYVAADMLSQAEHGDDSRCVLVTNSRELANSVLIEIDKQTATAERNSFIKASLNEYGIVIIARNIEECCEISNEFAPEHLELAVDNPWETLKLIKNAGTIMMGHFTPVPACDFAAGPNHTLPTNGTAKFSSALSVDDFLKKSGLLALSKKSLEKLAPTVLELAEAEGFHAHANTVRIRLSLDKE